MTSERLRKIMDAMGIRGRVADTYRPNILRAEDAAEGEFRLAGVIVSDEELTFYGAQMGLVSSGQLYEWLGARTGDVNILVNSPGGDVFAGVEMHSHLRRYDRGRVNVEIVGLAASAASLVSMGADHVAMRTGTEMMIHRAWTLAFGNCNELRHAADVLARLDGDLVDIYARRTEMPPDDLLALLDAETWMTPAEAVERGFADLAGDDDPEMPASAGDDDDLTDESMAAAAAIRAANAQIVRRRLAALGESYAV